MKCSALIKNKTLSLLHDQAKVLESIHREQNAKADSLSKQALNLADGTLVTQELKDEILGPSVQISLYDRYTVLLVEGFKGCSGPIYRDYMEKKICS